MEGLNLQFKKCSMVAVDSHTGEFLFLLTETELTLELLFLCFLEPSESKLWEEQR